MKQALLWLLIAMSPAALEAFGEITGAEVISGTMDLQEGGNAVIEALGRKDGVLVEITCRWRSGLPAWIMYRAAGEML